MAAQRCASEMLDVVHGCLHPLTSEWIFLRELRVGAGVRAGAGQRLDAFALNCFVHKGMVRVCYEVKVSRADFLCEMKRPLKRRIGLRYSNEFYFVTPVGLLNITEVPIECGLIEVGSFGDAEKRAVTEPENMLHFEPNHNNYCGVTVPAPWRESPGPTWQFVAGMMRNQHRALSAPSAKAPKQERLAF
jgi:hypothetical protein